VSTASVAFDPRPLTEPADRNAVAAFTRQLRAAGRIPPAFGGAPVIVAMAFVAGLVVLVLAVIFVATVGSVVSGDAQGSPGLIALFILLPFAIVAGAIGAIVFALVRGTRGTRERRYRLDRFARANGMSYLPSLETPGLPGMIFGIGSARGSTDLVRGDRPRFVEFANYTYTTGSGRNRTTHRWGYVAVKLDVPLPHIVLDATGNNSLFGSNLPTSFHKDQRLSLEGDFDRYFSLSCPTGYERDALYLFTPDIMARFIDNAAALDVEIVDDWLFLYTKREVSTLDPATWAWMFSVVAALLDKLAQWARWRDERLRAERATDAVAAASVTAPAAGAADAVPFAPPVGDLRPPPGVAPPGLRLKRRVPVAAFIVIGVVVVWWLFDLLAGGLFFMLR